MSPADLAAAFPDRPLTLAAPLARWRNWIFGLICLVVPIGLGWWTYASLGPAILADLTLRDMAQPVQGNVRGRCQTRWGLFQSCELKVSAGRTKGGDAYEQELEYIFVEPHVGSYEVTVMADPNRPGLLTTDMGLDHLTNRAVTLSVMLLLAVGIGVAGIGLIRRGGRERRHLREMSGRRLTPLPARVQRAKEGWTVTPLEGAGRSVWQLPAKTEPFWLDPARAVALAVSVPGAPVFPLDAALSWADMTEEERARLRAAAARTTSAEDDATVIARPPARAAGRP